MNNKRPKKGYGYIYKYTSPSGKSYIGQTVRSLQERAGHNGKNYKGCKLFYKAIKKYGLDNFDVEILAEIREEKLDELEIKYIQIFNTLAPNGYNLTKGGCSFKGKLKKKVYQYSTKTGELIKEWNNADEVAIFFGGSRQTLQSCLSGNTFTQWGYCWSYLKINIFPINERIVSPEKKKIKKFSLNGDFLNEYDSITQAALKNNLERSAIKKCCRGELKTYGGYIWKSSEIMLEKKFNNIAKKIQQIDPNTNEVIQVFNSISKAAKAFRKGTTLFRRVLDDEKRTAYGYRWKTAQGSTTKDS